MNFVNAAETETHVCGLRAHENKTKSSMEAGTSLCKNYAEP